MNKLTNLITGLFILVSCSYSQAFTVDTTLPNLITPEFEQYAPDPDAADQGAADTSNVTLFNIIDAQGVTPYFTNIMHHDRSGTTTEYKISTDLDLSSYINMRLYIENGAQFYVDAGITLTLPPNSNQITSFNDYVVGPGTVLNYTWYSPSTSVSDHGVDVTRSIKHYVDMIGSNNQTLPLEHSGGVTSSYTFLTSESIPSNITLDIKKGAIIVLGASAELTFDNPAQIKTGIDHQIFNTSSGGTVTFTNPGTVYPAWWDDSVGDNSTDVTTAYQEAVDSLLIGGVVMVSGGTSYIDPDISLFLDDNITLRGDSKTSVLKAIDGVSTDSGQIIKIASGTAVPRHPAGLISNIIVEGFTIDGNRDNHTVRTNATGGTTSASTTITTSTDFFIPSDADYDGSGTGRRIRIPNNEQAVAITNIVANGTEADVVCPRNDLKVGETIIVNSITGSGDIVAMNGNEFNITAVTRNFLDSGVTITVDKTISSGSYTSGGTVYGGSFAVLIDSYTSATEVEVNVPMIVTASSLDLQIDSGEAHHGILIQGGENVTIRDMIIKNCWGDGIDLTATFNFESGWQPPSENINIDNVVCDNNLRQGLSIEGVDGFTVSNSSFINTNGTGPASGIDIEPDGGRIVRNGSITSCNLSNNDGTGLTMSIIFTDTSGNPLVVGNADKTGSWGIKAKDNKIVSNGNHGVSIIGANEDIVLDSNTIWWNKKAGIRIRGNQSGAHMGPIRVVDNDIQYNYAILGVSSGVTDKEAGHGIVMANADSEIRMYGNNIRGNTIAWNDGHGVLVGGFSSYYNHIADNHIMSNSQLTNDIYSNIYDYGTTGEGLLIHDNVILEKFSNDNDRFGYTMTNFPLYAIFSSGGNLDTTLIYNNYISQSTTPPVYVETLHNATGAGRSFAWGNSGFKSESNVATIALNAATTGLTAVTVAHDLPFTPKVRDLYLSVVSDQEGSPLSAFPEFALQPIVEDIDGTTVYIRYNIDVAGTGNFKINCRVVSGRKL